MIDKTPVPAAASANHLKNVFEQSLAALSEEAEPPAKRFEKIRRSLPLHASAAELQKRALDNAANALASLWKISGVRVKPRAA